MTSSRNFLKNAAIYGLGSIATQVASAILLPLYTHYLTPADYGVLEILERTGQIITLLLLGNGIQMATFSFYCQAKTNDERQRTFSSIAVVLWIILALGALCAILLSPILASWLEIDSPFLVVLGIVVVLIQGAVTLPMALMQARVDSLAFVTVNLLSAVTRMTLTIVAVAVLGLGLWGVLGASLLCAGTLAVILTLREAARGLQKPDLRMAADIVRFALPLLPAGLLATVTVSGDRFFLLHFSSPAEIGTYSLGFKLAVVIPMLVIQPLWKVWSASLYEFYEEKDASAKLGRIVLRILAIHIFVGLGVCLFSVELVRLVAPADYMDASSVIPLLTLVSMFQLAANLFEASFWVTRKTNWKIFTGILTAAVALVAFYFLVPAAGSIGAALALVIAYAVRATVTYLVTQRLFFISYNWRAASTGAAMAIAVFVVGYGLDGEIVSILVKGVLWLAWPLLLWVFGVINRDEKAWVVQKLALARQYVGKLASAAFL